ncbi:MAG: hypothetical protein ABIO70_13650 [Pseudomonadota bacterium]
MNQRARAVLTWVGITAAYVLAAVVFTWPLACHLGSAIWGDRFDAWTTLWLLWFLHHAVATGTLAVTTDLISFPTGYNLWSFGHMALQALGVPLIGAGLSVTAAYNVLGIGGLAGTATAGHLLGHRLTGSHAGGALAACVLAYNPLLYGEFSVGSIELVAALFLPLYVLSLVRLCAQPTPARAAVLAAVLAITGPFNWYFSIFCILLTPPLALLLMVGQPRRTSGRSLLLLGAAGVVVLLLTFPLFDRIRRETPPRIPLSASVATHEVMARLVDFHDAQIELRDLDRADIEAFDAAQVVTNSTTVRTLLRQSFEVNPLDSTPGVPAIMLALAGFAAAPRRAWRWLALAALFTLLSLGPFLLWDAGTSPGEAGQTWHLPYYWLYNYVPYFSKAYRPYRLGIVTLTALAVLAAYAGPWLRSTLGRRGAAAVVVACAFLFATQPHWAPTHPARRGLASTAIPPVYSHLDRLPEGALIELPLLFQPVHLGVAHFQYYQVAHGRPMLNNNQLIRVDDLLALKDLALRNDLVDTFLRLSEPDATQAARVKAEDLRALCDAGFRLLTVHESFPADGASITGPADQAGLLPGPAFALVDDLFGPALLEEDDVRVYDLRRGIARAEAGPLPVHHWREGSLGALDLFATGHVPTLLPLTTEDDQAFPLGSAPTGATLAEVSLWVRVERGAGLALRFLGPDGARIGPLVPATAEVGAWRRLRAIAPAGAVAAELVNSADEPLAVAMTLAWVDTLPAASEPGTPIAPEAQP